MRKYDLILADWAWPNETAALREGYCPACATRLEPMPEHAIYATLGGVAGRCATHGEWKLQPQRQIEHWDARWTEWPCRIVLHREKA